MMGGWLAAAAAGLPQWGPDMDWNVQCDPDAARIVIEAVGDLTIAPLAPTLGAWLRAQDLPALEDSGPLGRLLARQAIAHAAQYDMARLAREHAALPDDLLNFHYDPVACAAALGWPEVTSGPTHVRIGAETPMRLIDHPDGRSATVVHHVESDVFAAKWLRAVNRLDRRGRPHVHGRSDVE